MGSELKRQYAKAIREYEEAVGISKRQEYSFYKGLIVGIIFSIIMWAIIFYFYLN